MGITEVSGCLKLKYSPEVIRLYELVEVAAAFPSVVFRVIESDEFIFNPVDG